MIRRGLKDEGTRICGVLTCENLLDVGTGTTGPREPYNDILRVPTCYGARDLSKGVSDSRMSSLSVFQVLVRVLL